VSASVFASLLPSFRSLFRGALFGRKLSHASPSNLPLSFDRDRAVRQLDARFEELLEKLRKNRPFRRSLDGPPRL